MVDIDIAGARPSVVTVRERIARSTHRCCECGDTIVPGEPYEHVRGCWDAQWRSYKTCTPCTALRHTVHEGGPYLYEGLAEAVAEWWRGWMPLKTDCADRADKAAEGHAVRRFRARVRRARASRE